MSRPLFPHQALPDAPAAGGRVPLSGPPGATWRSSHRGFSLVEVTIALGLVTFAAVSIIALLPTGLLVMREATSQTIEAQIVRSIAGQSVVSNFADLTNESPFYFDHEGQLLSSEDGSMYTATITRHPPVFPGSDQAAANLSASLTNLRIEIVERPHPQAVGVTSLHSLQVANYGK